LKPSARDRGPGSVGAAESPNHPLQRTVTSVMLHVKRRAGLGDVARSAERWRYV
jgi:hypothetical protein